MNTQYSPLSHHLGPGFSATANVTTRLLNPQFYVGRTAAFSRNPRLGCNSALLADINWSAQRKHTPDTQVEFVI